MHTVTKTQHHLILMALSSLNLTDGDDDQLKLNIIHLTSCFVLLIYGTAISILMFFIEMATAKL